MAISPPPMPNNPPRVPSSAPSRIFMTTTSRSMAPPNQRGGCYPRFVASETHSSAQWLCATRIGKQMNPDALTEQLALFLDVLEAGSFSAAARRHPLTPSAVARRIDNLEKALGSNLFVRS